MKLTYEQLNHLGILPAFRKIAAWDKHTAERALVVARLCESVEQAIGTGREKYMALLERHPIPKNEDGIENPAAFLEEKKEAFMAEHKAIMSEEVDIETEELMMNDLKGILFSAQEITAIAPFITDLKLNRK